MNSPNKYPCEYVDEDDFVPIVSSAPYLSRCASESEILFPIMIVSVNCILETLPQRNSNVCEKKKQKRDEILIVQLYPQTQTLWH